MFCHVNKDLVELNKSRYPQFWTIKLYIAINTCETISLVQQHCNGMLQTCVKVCQNFNKKAGLLQMY